jgi:membrane associated rhomboid family serine protease
MPRACEWTLGIVADASKSTAMSNFDLDPAEVSATRVRHDRARLRLALLGAGTIVIGIWVLWIVAAMLGWSLDDFGVRPRTLHGLVGIFTAPLVHGSFEHLMSNTLPMLVLGTLALYTYPLAARRALILIWVGSGIGVWMFARDSTHVGISGVAHGLMFFIFVLGLLRRERSAVTMALVVFFLYGGMVLTVLPREEAISFESHAFGAICGALAAVLWYKLDPSVPRKRYSWELEPEPDDELELELPRPEQIEPLWDGPSRTRPVNGSARVIEFPGVQRQRDEFEQS